MVKVLSDLLPIDIPSYAVVFGDTTSITGRQGEMCWSTTINTLMVGDGAKWVFAQQLGFNVGIVGKTLANERYPANSPYAFSMSAGRSVAKAGTAATASTVFNIRVNGVVGGTITFGAGSATGVVAITTAAIPVNAFIMVEAPATPDVALADIAITIRG